jgi:hypothetical protein
MQPFDGIGDKGAEMMKLAGILLIVICLLLAPAGAWAQGTGAASIAGVVHDASGAVLPGVVIEATSPALIEKVRSAVTDGRGLYLIADLRPGKYDVTFTIPGFSTVKREGIELTVGFTATVNADLAVGTLEETITVSGGAPIVDTRTVIQRTTLPSTTLDALPLARNSNNLADLLPQVVQVVAVGGGIEGETPGALSVNGGNPFEINVLQDGMNLQVLSMGTTSFNPYALQEIGMETAARSAEMYTAGVGFNIVQLDGGNTFSGSGGYIWGSHHLQQSNLTDALRARGLAATPSLKQFFDAGFGIGGPIKKDKLWFHVAVRDWKTARYFAGNYYNLTPHTLLYTPDPSRPGYSTDFYRNLNLRLTGQASSKDRVTGHLTYDNNCDCDIRGSGTIEPSANIDQYYRPMIRAVFTWSRPQTNRLLYEAGAAAVMSTLDVQRVASAGVTENDIGVVDTGLGITYGSRVGAASTFPTHNCCYGVGFKGRMYNQRFAASYVTGTHALKIGVTHEFFAINPGGDPRANDINMINQGVQYTFRNQIPQSVTIYATPVGWTTSSTLYGAFVQDRWTHRRLTMDLGLRFDTFSAVANAQSLGAGYFVPARSYPEVRDVPNWKNVNPRLGGSYDLFGTGRTALKASFGRYSTGTSSKGNNGYALIQPIQRTSMQASRTWNDSTYGPGDPRTGNLKPDCVLGPSNPAANGECGRLSDQNFGGTSATSLNYGDDALSGFNSAQPFYWQGSVSMDHEIRSGLSLTVNYNRTVYGNLNVTDNLAVAPADFDPYCITAPVDARLPGGGGNQICGLYDLKPEKFGLVNNLVSMAGPGRQPSTVFNGFDFLTRMRFGRGTQIQGGVSTGRSVTDTCFVVDSPQQTYQCHVSPTWASGTRLKFMVLYPLPWKLRASTIYQNLPGITQQATLAVSNALIVPTLGRNLGSCAGAATCTNSVTVNLIQPGTAFEPRINQMDFRLSRNFPMGRYKLDANLDVFNLLNTSSVIDANFAYGSKWLNPVQILAARMAKFSVQVHF